MTGALQRYRPKTDLGAKGDGRRADSNRSPAGRSEGRKIDSLRRTEGKHNCDVEFLAGTGTVNGDQSVSLYISLYLPDLYPTRR
jgi:hypothetical protein